jgi:hypothetical protein
MGAEKSSRVGRRGTKERRKEEKRRARSRRLPTLGSEMA